MHLFEDFVERSQATHSSDELLDVFRHTMADEGFENVILAGIGVGELTDVSWTVFPDRHFETYVEQGWSRVDPVLAYSLRAQRAFVWDDIEPRLKLARRQKQFLEDARRFGVHSCVIMPFQTAGGRREILGIGKRRREATDPARLPILHAMCAQAWWRHVDLRRGRRATDVGIEINPLSARELEILKWIKHGKTNSEIGEILTLSTKTIEYHVSSILRKLGASNRVTAVVIAVQNYIIEL